MNTDFVKIVLVIATLAAVAIGVAEYMRGREAVIRADAQHQADQAIIAEKEKQFSAVSAQFDQFKKDQDAKMTAMEARFSAANTPQQIASLAAQLMGLKQPITFVTPPATKDNPNPAPVAQISTIDTPAVKTYLQTCEECKIKLSTANATIDINKQRQQLSDEKLAAATDEAAKYRKAAQGSTWQRISASPIVKIVVFGIGVWAGSKIHH